MGQDVWNKIKNSKSFYVRTFRSMARGVAVSLFLNLFLSLALYYYYFHHPLRDFYATSGITAPVKLNPLDKPNYSSTFLLGADPLNDNTAKVIPD